MDCFVVGIVLCWDNMCHGAGVQIQSTASIRLRVGRNFRPRQLSGMCSEEMSPHAIPFIVTETKRARTYTELF